MAKIMKPFGINVDYLIDEASAAADKILVKLFRRQEGADNEVVATREYTPSGLPENIRRQMLIYGASKLVQDRTSDGSGTEDRLNSMDEVWERFTAGQWEKEREAGGPTVRIEVEALAAIKGVAVADIQRALRDYTAEARDKILNSAVVQAKVAEMQEARDTSPTDVDGLLDDLADSDDS